MPRSKSTSRGRHNGAPMITRLLPLPDEEVRGRLIEYHMILANLRLRRGDASHFVTMARVIVSTCHLFDAGYGEASLEGLTQVHDALERSFRSSFESGVWAIDEATFELFADLLMLHERQLLCAPLHAVASSTNTELKSRADRCRAERNSTEARTP